VANYGVPACPKCVGFTERLTFKTPAEYVEFVSQLVVAVNAHRFSVKRADCPLEALLLSPPWPEGQGDGVAHDLVCDGCSREFHLYVNIWNGRNWWEPQSEGPDPTPLSVFKTGQIAVMTAHLIKMKLEELIVNGLAEELSPPKVWHRQGETERWFRDTVSNVTYRLIEYFGFMDADNMRWEVVPPTEQGGRIQ
jgi:hypothetical protein